MPTIQLNNYKSAVASVATKLTLKECEQVKIQVEKNSPFSVKAYQGNNPDFRVITIPCYTVEDENTISNILRTDFLGRTVAFELLF